MSGNSYGPDNAPPKIVGARPIYNGTTYRLHDHLRKPNRFVSCPGGCGKMTRGSLCKTCEDRAALEREVFGQ